MQSEDGFKYESRSTCTAVPYMALSLSDFISLIRVWQGSTCVNSIMGGL